VAVETEASKHLPVAGLSGRLTAFEVATGDIPKCPCKWDGPVGHRRVRWDQRAQLRHAGRRSWRTELSWSEGRASGRDGQTRWRR